MNDFNTTQIYQIYYDKSQLALLDNDFIPWDNSDAEHPELCEYSVFKKLYDRQQHKQSRLLGTVSWKFFEKTHVCGKTFLNYIQQNPGYDVYFINPYPHLEKFRSVWHQGQCQGHPEIMQLAQTIFNELHYAIDIREISHSAAMTGYCNYWVGNSKFWEKYMTFSLPIYEYILHHASTDMRHKLLRQKTHKDFPQPYFPYIIERLFSTFLTISEDIRYQKYPYNYRELSLKYGKAKALYYLLVTKDGK